MSSNLSSVQSQCNFLCDHFPSEMKKTLSEKNWNDGIRTIVLMRDASLWGRAMPDECCKTCEEKTIKTMHAYSSALMKVTGQCDQDVKPLQDIASEVDEKLRRPQLDELERTQRKVILSFQKVMNGDDVALVLGLINKLKLGLDPLYEAEDELFFATDASAVKGWKKR